MKIMMDLLSFLLYMVRLFVDYFCNSESIIQISRTPSFRFVVFFKINYAQQQKQ